MKSFFHCISENKTIWISSRGPEDISWDYDVMVKVRDAIINEFYNGIIISENQLSFYLEDPNNPEPIPFNTLVFSSKRNLR